MNVGVVRDVLTERPTWQIVQELEAAGVHVPGISLHQRPAQGRHLRLVPPAGPVGRDEVLGA